MGQHENRTGIGGGRLAVTRSRDCALTRKLSPELSPTSLGLTLTRLKPLKRLERVKGIELVTPLDLLSAV